MGFNQISKDESQFGRSGCANVITFLSQDNIKSMCCSETTRAECHERQLR